MSQHIYENGDLHVRMGYDRPLNYVFCTVERDGEMIYSNLSDDGAGTEQQDVWYFNQVLHRLGIAVPVKMFAEIEKDQRDRVGNRVVEYGIADLGDGVSDPEPEDVSDVHIDTCKGCDFAVTECRCTPQPQPNATECGFCQQLGHPCIDHEPQPTVHDSKLPDAPNDKQLRNSIKNARRKLAEEAPQPIPMHQWGEGRRPVIPAKKVALARKAIENGRTMGQFLRDLPGSHKMTPAELQEYGRAYAKARHICRCGDDDYYYGDE
jgi:hypothetical protein